LDEHVVVKFWRELTFKLARLSNDSTRDVSNPNKRAVVGFGHQRAANHFGAIDIDFHQVTSHFCWCQLYPKLPSFSFDDPRCYLPLCWPWKKNLVLGLDGKSQVEEPKKSLTLEVWEVRFQASEQQQ